MFYTYTANADRIYLRNLEDCVAAATRIHLGSGRDIKYITVYELLTDRIAVQYCASCGHATLWIAKNRVVKCDVCKSRYSNMEVPDNRTQQPLEHLACCFELFTNYAFNATNFDLFLQRTRWHPPGVFRQTIDAFTIRLRESMRMRGFALYPFVPNEKDEGKRTMAEWYRMARLNDARVRVMDMHAFSSTPNLGAPK